MGFAKENNKRERAFVHQFTTGTGVFAVSANVI
jgi:hypothetical protein